MSNRPFLLHINDIADAIRKILSYTDRMSYEEFVDDEKTIDAVARNVAIIGEAARNIPLEIH